MKFPKLIHVVEERPANDKPFLMIVEGGVFGVDETTPAAIYQLVKSGRVTVTRAFVANPPRQKIARGAGR